MGKDMIVNRAWKVQPWTRLSGVRTGASTAGGGGSLRGPPGEAVTWAKLGRQRGSQTLLPALMVPECVCHEKPRSDFIPAHSVSAAGGLAFLPGRGTGGTCLTQRAPSGGWGRDSAWL